VRGLLTTSCEPQAQMSVYVTLKCQIRIVNLHERRCSTSGALPRNISNAPHHCSLPNHHKHVSPTHQQHDHARQQLSFNLNGQSHTKALPVPLTTARAPQPSLRIRRSQAHHTQPAAANAPSSANQGRQAEPRELHRSQLSVSSNSLRVPPHVHAPSQIRHRL
jgi:hypothetical protein